jgi:hypothetical protein
VRVWVVWALVTLVLATVPLALSDPALLGLVLDPELLALTVAVLYAALRLNAQIVVERVRLWSVRTSRR